MPKRAEKTRIFKPEIIERNKKKLEKDADKATEEKDLSSDELDEYYDKRILKGSQIDQIDRLLVDNSQSLIWRASHCAFPAFNVTLCPHDNREVLPLYPSCQVSAPHPIYVANKQCETVDLCHKRSMTRDFYRKRLLTTRTTYQRAVQNKKQIRAAEKEEIYHCSAFDMAERVFLNPDPYFHGSYDYYYTGGNLCILPQTRQIVHVTGNNLHTLNLGKLSREKTSDASMKNLATLDLKENTEIFEVQSLSPSTNSTYLNRFICRQRNVVSIYGVTDDCSKTKTLALFKNQNTPFISVAQSMGNVDTLLISNMKQHLRQYDLKTSAPFLVKLYDVKSQKSGWLWNTIKPWRENTFIYANEKQLSLIDLRTPSDQWPDNVNINRNGTCICDHITALTTSAFDNLLYVCTNHALHCLDIRNFKTSSLVNSQNAVCRWTHQCQYAPLMMETYKDENKEYIALSSPVSGDLCICEMSRTPNSEICELAPTSEKPAFIYKSFCLPYQPPTLMEAYNSARLQGNCLQPEANLHARLQCCTTGLKFYDLGANDSCKRKYLIFSNSNGDVYAHTLIKRDKVETDARTTKVSNEMMGKYAENICSFQSIPLHYSDIVKLKGMRKIFRCEFLSNPSKYDFETTIDANNEDEVALRQEGVNSSGKRKRFHMGRWQKSSTQLHSYKDALVEDLLSIWDVDMEVEGDAIQLKNLSANQSMKAETKVNNWLNAQTVEHIPMTSIAPSEAIKYFQDDSIVNDQLFDLSQSQQILRDFEDVHQSTQIDDLNASKSRKKSKKYTKGF
ncbi:uncharacterized protein LOC119644726 [Glossina fuscipes]|uniref:Uncharacterized protein LOC119644726 n=1 Tax=Glossina fuscipes TaxID=7396 RepID=A0A9C5ZIM0_9MUSC|nr:uncharacterized protein LOC119644726 [Glossina fuscipes]KAI9588904.1 hypothetical protein GQX74_007073 [Glossina fuscipes]